MSSQDFPTYGRGEEPDQPAEEHHYAPPSPYSGDTYGTGPHGEQQPGHYAQPQPGAYNSPQYGAPPQTQPSQAAYTQPPVYRPGHPYGAPAHPQQHQIPAYGRETPSRDPRAARVLLLAASIAAVYGLLVVSVQRVALREISQAPGSPLNHPLRTDVIDTIGQLLLLLVGAAAIGMWVRDVLSRRKAGRQPDSAELGGLLQVGVSLVPILVGFVMVLSTGMGAADETIDRLPTAYGWGGIGLLILAVGLFLGYRELKPDVPNAVVQAAPARPPWE